MTIHITAMRVLFICVFIITSIGTSAQSDPTLKKYYDRIRAAFQEQNAFETVAYVEQRWRCLVILALMKPSIMWKVY